MQLFIFKWGNYKLFILFITFFNIKPQTVFQRYDTSSNMSTRIAGTVCGGHVAELVPDNWSCWLDSWNWWLDSWNWWLVAG
jgi:hypothetical protein